LYLVEGEAAQIAQRGIGSPEVVERNADPKGAQFMQHLVDGVAIAQQQTLGNLELETVCRQTRAVQRVGDRLIEIAVLELYGRQIDRDLDILAPARCVPTGLVEYPGSNWHNQARFFGDGNELAGGDHALDRMTPANKRLEAGDRLCLHVQD